jgi:hypothetical protein
MTAKGRGAADIWAPRPATPFGSTDGNPEPAKPLRELLQTDVPVEHDSLAVHLDDVRPDREGVEPIR